jgi:RNase P/RNase MRP subunit POP5
MDEVQQNEQRRCEAAAKSFQTADGRKSGMTQSRRQNVENVLASRLVFKTMKVKVHKIVILPVVLSGRGTGLLH